MAKNVTRQTKVTGMLAFNIADMLGMEIKETRDPVALSGTGKVPLTVGGVDFGFNQKIVGSHILADVHFVMVRTIGNLALLVSAERKGSKEQGKLTLVNLAKLTGPVEKWLDTVKPQSHADATTALGAAAVKTFPFHGKWAQPKG